MLLCGPGRDQVQALQVLEVLELEEIEVLLEQLVQLILVAVEVEVDLIVNNHQKMLVVMVVQVS